MKPRTRAKLIGSCCSLALVLGLLLAVGPALAAEGAPVGPAQAKTPNFLPAAAGKFTVGMEGTWVFQEDFKDSTDHATFAGDGSVARAATELKIKDDRRHMVTLAYGLHPRVNLLAKVGLAHGGILKETLGGRFVWESHLQDSLVWGLGAKGLLWSHPKGLGLVLGVEYLRWDDRGVDYWRSPEGWTTKDDGTVVDSKVDYWRLQADLTLLWRLGHFTPYVGAGLMYSEVKFSETWTYSSTARDQYTLDAADNRDILALKAGLACELGRGWSLQVQGAFLAAWEAGLGLAYAF